jgi:hypothetical protein
MRLKTQDSAYLEKGKGYNKNKVLKFLKQREPAALDEKNYQRLKKIRHT